MGSTMKSGTLNHQFRTTLETAVTHANFKQDKIMIMGPPRRRWAEEWVSWEILDISSSAKSNVKEWRCSPFNSFQACKRPNLFTYYNYNAFLGVVYIEKPCKWDFLKNRAVRIACALVLYIESYMVLFCFSVFSDILLFTGYCLFHLRSLILFHQRSSSEKGGLLTTVDQNVLFKKTGLKKRTPFNPQAWPHPHPCAAAGTRFTGSRGTLG